MGGDVVYSIADAAKMVGVSASTLRYYDKEGLLPGVQPFALLQGSKCRA